MLLCILWSIVFFNFDVILRDLKGSLSISHNPHSLLVDQLVSEAVSCAPELRIHRTLLAPRFGQTFTFIRQSLEILRHSLAPCLFLLEI